MKLLIPCSAAASPQAIIHDLEYAGLPSQSHALLLLPKRHHAMTPVLEIAQLRETSRKAHGYHPYEQLLEIDEEDKRIRAALLDHFPNWFIEFESDERVSALESKPSQGSILEAARAWRADMILLGSERRDRSRDSLQSLSRIASEAPCSVRIVHPRYQHPDAPLQLMAYIDGTEQSVHLIEGFASRPFPRNTRLHLMSVVSKREKEIGIIHQMLDYFAEHLRQEFPHIESQIRYGDPVEQILHYVEQQEIDSIFLPTTSAPENARIQTAILVAQHAETTVEIFRYSKTSRHSAH